MNIRRLYILFALLLPWAPSMAQQPAQSASASMPPTTAPAPEQAPARPTATQAPTPPAYFIDGYHGGIYGHIPQWQTQFMVEKLREFPDWKINLELEPASWDSIAIEHPDDYAAFKTYIADQSADGRVEYVNPAYGQSYLYDISGESIIRQFYYGIRKLRQHFPNLVFSSYSSEEPCFTSALPQILTSYGFKYASLKNPNTCWGGYTRAHGGELVNWIGSDGTSLLAVPRYAIEALKPHSTWETIAENNSLAYVLSAFQAGIKAPVGMCLQDAGWAFGPWIKPGEAYQPGMAGDDQKDIKDSYHPTVYETWRGYIEHHTPGKTADDWHFSQEDVLTSLVWGGQVLQQVARNVRHTENHLVAAEKLAAMAAFYKGVPWPGASFDEAWRTLLLSQHHDCWIVPYNVVRNTTHTWAQWVDRWTGNSDHRADSIVERSMAAFASGLTPSTPNVKTATLTVFNTTATDRNECVEFELPAGWRAASIIGPFGGQLVGQPVEGNKWLFRAHVRQLGTTLCYLHEEKKPATHGHYITRHKNKLTIETDLYSLTLDAARGGVITRLMTKGPEPKDFVDDKSPHYLNELRGNFYEQGGFHSSTETPAKLTVLERGPLRMRVQIDGHIAATPFTQWITVTQDEPRIDIHLEIHWSENHRIGESPDSIKGYPLKKEFYNDSFKLQVLFPVALENQKIYKNAPFDVLQSKLDNTFFDSWDSIKNVVAHKWVDVTDGSDRHGLAVFTDETTSYAHGPNYPLALTVAYSGPGLFGRDYTITGPTTMDYAILPHTGRWDQAGIWTAATRWNEPLLAKVNLAQEALPPMIHNLFRLSNSGWEASAITVNGADLDLRLFNAEAKDTVQRIYPDFPANTASLVALDGHVIQQLDVHKDQHDKNYILITAPRFGIRTIQFKDVIK